MILGKTSESGWGLTSLNDAFTGLLGRRNAANTRISVFKTDLIIMKSPQLQSAGMVENKLQWKKINNNNND